MYLVWRMTSLLMAQGLEPGDL